MGFDLNRVAFPRGLTVFAIVIAIGVRTRSPARPLAAGRDLIRSRLPALPKRFQKEASMPERSPMAAQPFADIVKAMGEEPIFKVGDSVKIAVRFPVGHYRVPRYIRGTRGTVEAVITPAAVNNEQEGLGQNGGVTYAT